MAVGQYNLIDLAARSGNDQVHALIEGVLTYAPEMRVVPAYPKAGISYTTLTRTGLPSGSFAKVGAGVAPQKSEWSRAVGSMAKFEAQMRVPVDVVTIAQSEDSELATGDILSDEAAAYMQGSAITLGSQFWYGKNIGEDGFAGLSTLVDTENNELAVGTAGNANTSPSNSVYLVYFPESSVNPDGIHFVVGNNGRMTFDDVWLKQQIPDPNDATHTKLMSAFCNDFLSFLGLVMTRTQNVYRAKNITAGANGFTDAVASALLAKVPLKLRANLGRWKWFMNSQALFTLQASRATVNVATGSAKGVGSGGVFPDVPTSCQGIEIVPTDSLLTTDIGGLYGA